jgi:exopolyphosphatase/guanosine-5'-triphosphate,3'-diphosphate pyrophosphatase
MDHQPGDASQNPPSGYAPPSSLGGPPPARAAALDVGTNTVRLLVGEPDGQGGFRPLFAAQEITRLGEGLLPERLLQPIPMERTLAALRRFGGAAAAHGAETLLALGTSALREARNREEFLRRATDEAGVRIRVIPGDEEARLTLRGVVGGLRERPPRMLLVDIGGGSTEFLVAEGERARLRVSTGLGVVKLTEAHLTHDPPRPAELQGARQAVAARLERLRAGELAGVELPEVLVGTAGTITSLAAIDLALEPYDPARVTGHRLSRRRVKELVTLLAGSPLAARRRVRGLEPARADVIVAGGLICLVGMELLGYASLVVSDAGLREGILLATLAGEAVASLSGPPGDGALDTSGARC